MITLAIKTKDIGAVFMRNCVGGSFTIIGANIPQTIIIDGNSSLVFRDFERKSADLKADLRQTRTHCNTEVSTVII